MKKSYAALPSTVTSDTLIVFRKRFFFPNDLVVKVPEKFERIQNPPPGYISCSEKILRAGFRFPILPEVLELLQECNVALSQFSYRALMVIMGLVVFFREKGKLLNASYLGGLCKFFNDTAGHVGFRAVKGGVHFLVPAHVTNWASGFFFVRNEWRLRESWGEFRGFKNSKSATVDEILRAVHISSREVLESELRYINRFVTEDRLFGARISIQDGGSHALPLKHSLPDASKLPSALVLPSERSIPRALDLSPDRLSSDQVPVSKRH